MKTNKKGIVLSAMLLSVCFSVSLKSQVKQSELIKGKTVSDMLITGEKHRYNLKLEAGQFAFLRLRQNGADVMITTIDPDGNKIQDFNTPNGRHGDELVTLLTGRKGNYALEVVALGDKSRQGRYDLTLERLEPKGETPQKQIDQLFSPWANPQVPGAAVAVEKDGKIIFKKGYGSADPEHNVPITPSTVFHIASVSKQFTAFSILMLENAGKLSVNDDVRKYIPEVPDFGKVITLNQLIHHTSGIRDQWELLGLGGWRLDDIITKDQILNLISHQKDLNFNPGDEYSYSNTGYTLLAEVVARVSGQTFAEFTRTHIFEPLKMNNTLFYDDCEKLVRNRAYSYHIDTTGLKKSILSYSTVGATSLFTTADDLSQWAHNFENPVVGKEFINKINQKGILNNGDTIDYAMGQEIGKYKGLKIISHGGADAGYRSFFVRFPDQKFSVNILSNLASFDPYGMAMKISDICLKDKLKEEPRKEISEKPEIKTISNIKLDPDSLISYCGQYALFPGAMAVVTTDNSNLFVEAPRLTKTMMIPVSSNTFDVNVLQARAAFLRDANGKINRIKVWMGGEVHDAMRMPDFDPAKVDLSAYTGEYYSPELSTTYTVLTDGGSLIARHFRTGDVHLVNGKPDYFMADRFYFRSAEFVRDNDQKVIGLKISSARNRNLRFEKVN